MKRRGRQKAAIQPVVFSLKLCLYPGRNDALIDYLRNAPARLRAQYVLQALESGQLQLPTSDQTSPAEALDFSQMWQ
jgi:hypothetical protein